MSEPIRDTETAVRELGALPVPIGAEPQLTPERLAEIRDLVRYESSIKFYSHRAKESVLLLIEEAERVERLRNQCEAHRLQLNELSREHERVVARLAEYERPADEDPIAFALTEQAAEAPFTEARAAFMQMGRTPSLEGLRAELRIEGNPPLVGRYVGASMGRLHDVPGHEHLLAIDPRLIFEYGEEADA
jgi:hypothetical protein